MKTQEKISVAFGGIVVLGYLWLIRRMDQDSKRMVAEMLEQASNMFTSALSSALEDKVPDMPSVPVFDMPDVEPEDAPPTDYFIGGLDD